MLNPVVSLLGEAMLELSAPAEGFKLGKSARLGYGGDTVNTAVYLSRLGVKTRYVSALGRDPFSVQMLREWEAEGLVVDSVLQHPTRTTGLYAIETDSDGERSFHYWRDSSAVRTLFDLDGVDAAMERASHCHILFLSGITLSLFSDSARSRIHDLARRVRLLGGRVAFDPNFRARLWDSRETAVSVFLDFARECDVVLPSCADEDLLFGKASVDVHARRWQDTGVPLVVMKRGPEGSRVYQSGSDSVDVPASPASLVLDTTGAGDSFNAGFLTGLVKGCSVQDSAGLGSRLASQVIAHRGAIVPHSVTEKVRDHLAVDNHTA